MWSPGQWPKEKKKGKGKSGESAKTNADKKPVVRAYNVDGGSASSHSAAAGSTQPDGNMQALFKEFAEIAKVMNHPLQEKLKALVPNNDRMEIKDQQRRLNRMRNLRNRIESKEKAIKTDETRWEHWLKEIKDSIVSQRKEHEDTQSKMKEELKQLQKEEEELKNGTEEIQVESEGESEDPELMIDQWLKEEKKNTEKKPAQTLELSTAMEMEKNMEAKYQQRLEQERAVMQREMHLMMQQAMKSLPSGAEIVDLQQADAAMETGGKPPNAEAVQAMLDHQFAIAHAACVPFGVARRSRRTPNTSPYGRETPVIGEEDAKKEEKVPPAPETGQL